MSYSIFYAPVRISYLTSDLSFNKNYSFINYVLISPFVHALDFRHCFKNVPFL